MCAASHPLCPRWRELRSCEGFPLKRVPSNLWLICQRTSWFEKGCKDISSERCFNFFCDHFRPDASRASQDMPFGYSQGNKPGSPPRKRVAVRLALQRKKARDADCSASRANLVPLLQSVYRTRNPYVNGSHSSTIQLAKPQTKALPSTSGMTALKSPTVVSLKTRPLYTVPMMDSFTSVSSFPSFPRR